MTHSLGKVWVLDVDHTAHGFCTDPVGLHVPPALEAILGCEPTELCLQPRTCYGSYSSTKILLYSAPLLHGAKLGSAPDLDQLLTGKVGLTLLFGP